MSDRSDLLAEVVAIARRAARAVMVVYRQDDAQWHLRRKADGSPVSDADEQAEALITPALQALLPGVAVVAEEAMAAGARPEVGDRFWLVDPLDGTKEFISRNGEFTVNIALIESGVPVLGVVVAPALERLYAGAQGVGARVSDLSTAVAHGVDVEAWRDIACRHEPAEGATALVSRSHGGDRDAAQLLSGRKLAEVRRVGSSLKFCLLADGQADAYPRWGRTMEWDTAAGHAVLLAAGGRVCTLDGQPLRYGKQGFENPPFMAFGA